MPPIRSLPLAPALVIAASLAASAAHAEARRSAQSFPAPRMSLPAFFAIPPRVATPPRPSHEESIRASLDQPRKPERENSSKPGIKDHDRFDNRRYDNDREEYERAKERAGHHFGGHGRDDSPGC